MSSARNHAKRSHRSEHFKRSSIGASTRKMWVKQAHKPQRLGFLDRVRNLFRRREIIGNN